MPRIFYFAAMDCDHNLHFSHKTLSKVELEMEFTNQFEGENADQFSYEDQGLMRMYGVFMIAFIMLFGFNVNNYIQYRKTFDRYDSPHFVILIALYLQSSGIFMKYLHCWIYSSNGRGFAFFDIMSLICFMLAEIGMSSLLMLFASGWTLSF